MIEGDKTVEIEKCRGCLKKCSKKYCIINALNNACRGGDAARAVVFAGEQVEKVKEILPVRMIFQNLLNA